MQRRKDLWGPTGALILVPVSVADSDSFCLLPTMGTHKAEEFDPDRFADDRKTLLASNPFMFLPFNAGPRICLGQQVRNTVPAASVDVTSFTDRWLLYLHVIPSLASSRTMKRPLWLFALFRLSRTSGS